MVLIMHALQASKPARESPTPDKDEDDIDGDKEDQPKKHNRAAALAASKAQPVALVTSKRASLATIDCNIIMQQDK